MHSSNINLFPVWLIRSKVHPTKQRMTMLERPSLLWKLNDSLNASISLLNAPAGYGKSTLLASWCKQLQSKGFRVCWLSLDSEDNEPFQLLAYIAYALAEGGVSFDNFAGKDPAFFNDISTRTFLGIINHVIDVQDDKVLLILDDFENLDEAVIESIIKPLLGYATDNLHIAIASRDDSRLNVTRLETQGRVVRILADRMRFTLDEIKTFFATELPAKTIERIYRLTEGWPVAIQMIHTSIGTNQSIENLLANFKSDSHLMATYLSEQIFNDLTAELQTFLMDIALTDRVSVPFANYLREADDSAFWFNACKPLNSLVLPLEQLEHTYRLHPLFREYLSHRLTTAQAGKARVLHLRTANWFAAAGNIVKAVSHCVQAEQTRRALEIITEAGGINIWLREGLTRLRAIAALLGEASLLSSPRVAAIHCLIDIKDGKVHQASENHATIIQRYKRSKDSYSAQEQSQIEHEMLLLECLLAIYEGKLLSRDMCIGLTGKINQTPATEHPVLSYHYTLLCLTYAQKGMLREARHYAESASAEIKQFRSVYGDAYNNLHLGDICFAEGKTAECDAHYQTSLHLIRCHFNDDKGMKLVASTLVAELKYELNQLDSLTGTTKSIPGQLEECEAWFDIYAAGYTTASNMAYHQHGIDAALLILDRAMIYAASQQLSRLDYLLSVQRAGLLLRAGHDEQAAEVLRASAITLDNYLHPEAADSAWRECDAAVHAITLLQIKQGRYKEALAALDYFHADARTHGRVRSCLLFTLLKSLACQGMNDHEQSLKQLGQALAWSRRSGFVRIFIDAGRPVLSLLESYIAAVPKQPELADQAKDLIHQFSAPDDHAEPEQLLSKRELEVLQELMEGGSNKRIAKNIGVSENTVRFHLKNIFAKLQVENRLQAVNAAQKLHII